MISRTETSSLVDGDTNDDAPSIWFSKRFYVAVVIFLCFTNTIVLLCSVNIAVVEMTSAKQVTIGNITIERPADFPWDSATIGIVASAFLYGELLSFFGSFFVKKIGGSTSCALCMTISGILVILQPATLNLDYYLFLANRFVNGFFVGSFLISTTEIYSKWFPKKERSTLISLCYNGSHVGITISYPVFGYIANRWGWQMVFYVSGALSVAFALLCITFVKNRPIQDSTIRDKELKHILDGTEDSSQRQVDHYPYKQILLSVPVLAVCLSKFALLWVDTILNGCLPLYVKDLTGQSTDVVGVISSIPTAISIFIFPAAGVLLDWWKNNSNIELTRMHKIAISSAFLSSSVFFVAIVLLNNFTWSMVFFVLIQIALTGVPLVIEPIIVSIIPNYASIVAGLAFMFGVSATIISRTLTGFMTNNNTSQEWNNCFLLLAAVLVTSTVIFIKFGSSETQSLTKSSSEMTDGERDHLIAKYKQKNTL